MSRPTPSLPFPMTTAPAANSAPPKLLDLGSRATDWLRGAALCPVDIVTVEPPAGDPARRIGPFSEGRRVRARPEQLPFRDGFFDAAAAAGVLEHAGDDLEALDEISRVLRPGGLLLLRTPRAGPLTWLDPFNLYRYVAEVSGRGPMPVESGALGWRRHYRPDVLAALLAERGLIVVSTGGAGFGFAEAAVFLSLIGGRIVLRSGRAESGARRLLRPFVRFEGNLPAGRFGYDIVIRAVRTTPPAPSNP